MIKNENDNKGFQWDQYWSIGNLHSLSHAFSGNYEGAIAEFWSTQFSKLEDGAKILDIGTGNGAVAIIAAGVAKQKGINFHIDAIDLAKIDPAKATESQPELAELVEKIDFRGQISAHELPFDDQKFDLIVGQFALEYTPIDSTLTELRRVLSNAGCMSFIIHHTDSIIMKTTRDELHQAQLIFDKTKLFLRARSLIKAMGDADTAIKREKLKNNKNTEKKRNNLNQALGELKIEVDKREDPMFLLTAMNYVAELFKSRSYLSSKDKLAYLQHSQQLIKGNQERIQDLYNACFNEEKATIFCDLCVKKGFKLPKYKAFYDENQQLIGYSMFIGSL